MPDDQSNPDPREALRPDRHRRAAEFIRLCLALGDWTHAPLVLFVRLTRGERLLLLLATAYALNPDDRDDAIRDMFRDCIPDVPPPPFLDPLADARFWAACTTRRHLEATGAAVMEHLPPARRDALADYGRRLPR